MACALRPDPTGACDFLGTAGQNVNIVVKGVAPATIFRAEFNGAALPLSADQTSTTFAPPAGGGALLIEVTVAPGDTVQILEDCGGGQTQTLRQATAVDPIKRITICA